MLKITGRRVDTVGDDTFRDDAVMASAKGMLGFRIWVRPGCVHESSATLQSYEIGRSLCDNSVAASISQLLLDKALYHCIWY